MAWVNASPLALVRSHPKTTVFAALIVCSPVLPFIILSSPFLLCTSLFSISFLSFVRCVLQLRDPRPSPEERELALRSFKRGPKCPPVQGRVLEQEGGLRDDGWLHRTRTGVEGVRQTRVHEYLEDQLKNVVAMGRNDDGEDPLPCSFFYSEGLDVEHHEEEGQATELLRYNPPSDNNWDKLSHRRPQQGEGSVLRMKDGLEGY